MFIFFHEIKNKDVNINYFLSRCSLEKLRLDKIFPTNRLINSSWLGILISVLILYF